ALPRLIKPMPEGELKEAYSRYYQARKQLDAVRDRLKKKLYDQLHTDATNDLLIDDDGNKISGPRFRQLPVNEETANDQISNDLSPYHLEEENGDSQLDDDIDPALLTVAHLKSLLPLNVDLPGGGQYHVKVEAQSSDSEDPTPPSSPSPTGDVPLHPAIDNDAFTSQLLEDPENAIRQIADAVSLSDSTLQDHQGFSFSGDTPMIFGGIPDEKDFRRRWFEVLLGFAPRTKALARTDLYECNASGYNYKSANSIHFKKHVNSHEARAVQDDYKATHDDSCCPVCLCWVLQSARATGLVTEEDDKDDIIGSLPPVTTSISEYDLQQALLEEKAAGRYPPNVPTHYGRRRIDPWLTLIQADEPDNEDLKEHDKRLLGRSSKGRPIFHLEHSVGIHLAHGDMLPLHTHLYLHFIAQLKTCPFGCEDDFEEFDQFMLHLESHGLAVGYLQQGLESVGVCCDKTIPSLRISKTMSCLPQTSYG
ncbi:hypothetical protein FRC02_002403, partial [Tulasnella sp. 418]